MPALKLFISHSSRLDDMPDRYTDKDANWRLLQQVVNGLKARYGEAISILVDKDGLIPGDDWSRELNLWLAECQAAIILVTKRALERSDWVAKEAAILGWRKALDPDFTLIPVTIEGDSKVSDLSQGFFGSLDMGRIQCLHANRNADEIVAGLVRRLGEPEDLAVKHAVTPLDRLQGGITKILADNVTADSIAAALEAVGGTATVDRASNRERYAELLARRLLQRSLDEADACFQAFQRSFGVLAPKPPKERALELFAAVRSLWVHPGAAAYLAAALERKGALALTAQLILQADPELGAEAYTLERYVERAWPQSPLLKLVSVPARYTSDQVRAQIRESMLGRMPPGSPPFLQDMRDEQIRRDPRMIVLVVDSRSDGGGLPDPVRRRDLERLAIEYGRLILIFGKQATDEPLPDDLTPVQPSLEPTFEGRAFLAERSAAITLRDSYPKNQADGLSR
jgi:hypothetical protein